MFKHGFASDETWVVFNWISSNKEAYEEWSEIAIALLENEIDTPLEEKRGQVSRNLAKILEERYDTEFLLEESNHRITKDLMKLALKKVKWSQIADIMCDGLEVS